MSQPDMSANAIAGGVSSSAIPFGIPQVQEIQAYQVIVSGDRIFSVGELSGSGVYMMRI
jgi:hypothetical protein